MKQSIGDFLLRRLHEAGIRHIFGVPGDYNLEFMQQLEDRGDPAWIGNCNELNGAYAADGYARIHGLGALVVTYGVGSLSAMNGIAGAYSEHVPVICICGSLPLRSRERSELMHHTTHTVLRNLTDGVLLVTLVLFLFLGNVRSALIVAVTIPTWMLFASRYQNSSKNGLCASIANPSTASTVCATTRISTR